MSLVTLSAASEGEAFTSVAEKGRSKLLLRRVGTGGGETEAGRRAGKPGGCGAGGRGVRPPLLGTLPGLMQPRLPCGGTGAALLSSPRCVPAFPGGNGEKMHQLITPRCYLLSPTLSDKHIPPHPLVTPLTKTKVGFTLFYFPGIGGDRELVKCSEFLWEAGVFCELKLLLYHIKKKKRSLSLLLLVSLKSMAVHKSFIQINRYIFGCYEFM